MRVLFVIQFATLEERGREIERDIMRKWKRKRKIYNEKQGEEEEEKEKDI